ncbi:MAG: hypothetical protein IT220_07545 [Flavobacteriaceae bacterium]|nr:hypothetical protein [Flavobacteriaceae bacterium]
MRIFYLFFLLLWISQPVSSQQIQWAHSLIKYSSDLGGKQYGIKRILGKPDVFPTGGYSPNAWSPKNALDGREVIIIGLEKPQTVKQVAIFENLNAGCVTKISLSTDGEKFETVWTRKPDYQTPVFRTTLATDRSYYFGRKRRKVEDIPEVINPGIEHAFLDKAYSQITAVKVELNFALIPGGKQLDAIGVSDSDQPIVAVVNTKPEFDNLTPSLEVFDRFQHITSVCVSNDGSVLYAGTTTDSGLFEIYTFTQNETGNWDHPKIEPQIIEANAYNFVEFADANYLLKGGSTYTKGSNESGFVLFSLANSNYISQGHIKIAAYNNYNDYADASITSDLKVLVMAIETDFSQGGSDLYFAFQKEDGTYGFLQNMGKNINSAAEEFNPQLLSDQKTLLFASDGYSGFGNFDLYVSYRLDDTWKNWSIPVNLGSQINSAEFEGSPHYDEIGQTLYYTTFSENQPVVKSVQIPLSMLKL